MIKHLIRLNRALFFLWNGGEEVTQTKLSNYGLTNFFSNHK